MKKPICFFLSVLVLISAFAAQASESPLANVPADFRYLTLLENGFAGIGDEEELTMLSYDGEKMLSIPLRSVLGDDELFAGMVECCEDGSGGLFALFAKDGDTSEPKLHLFHFSKKGEVLWSTLFEQTANWGWTQLVRDGVGGVVLVHVSWDNYKETILRRFSADGQILWKKLLRTDGLIFEPFVARPAETGGFMLYATALSKSKGVYKALELCIDPEGVILQASARDFSFRPDYSASLKWEPLSDEILFISRENYLDTLGTEEICVSMSSLEPCSLPDISIIEADSTVH